MTDHNPTPLEDFLKQKCPYIGLYTDLDTHFDYPSNLNYCHRSSPIQCPSAVHQSFYCLSERYLECPLMKDQKRKRLPKKYRNSRKFFSKKMRALIGFVLIVLVLLTFLIYDSVTSKNMYKYYNKLSLILNPPQEVLPTRTPSPTNTGTLIPTATTTPTPTETLTPSLTPTPACEFSVRYFAVSYYANDKIQITYDTTLDLRPYLLKDETGNISQQLELPGFILLRNGSPILNYGTFLRNSAMPGRLYLEVVAFNEDVFELEFSDNGIRYCSTKYMVPSRATKVSHNVPNQTQKTKPPSTPIAYPITIP